MHHQESRSSAQDVVNQKLCVRVSDRAEKNNLGGPCLCAYQEDQLFKLSSRSTCVETASCRNESNGSYRNFRHLRVGLICCSFVASLAYLDAVIPNNGVEKVLDLHHRACC